MDKNSPMTEGEKEVQERDRIRYQTILASVFKFKFFFVGLVFAILAFSMQFPAKSNCVLIKAFEIISWILFLTTGYLALKDVGGFHARYNEKAMEGIGPKWRKLMWELFLAGIISLMFSKFLESLLGSFKLHFIKNFLC